MSPLRACALLLPLLVLASGCAKKPPEEEPPLNPRGLKPLPRSEYGQHFYFGHDLNMSGDDLIVGMPGAEESAGVVYIFHAEADGGWDEGFRIKNPRDTKSCRFGHAVDISGNWAIAAARFACAAPGRVHVFKRVGTGNQWEQALELEAPDAFTADMFGDDVAIENDVLAIGQGNHRLPGDPATYSGGPVYVSALQNGAWGPLQKLAPDGGYQSGGTFGAAVALSGDDLLVGTGRIGTAVGDTDTSVYFYRRTPGTAQYTQVARTTPPPGKGGNFGQTISIAKNLVVVGAPEDGLTGRAYVLERPNEGSPFGPPILLQPIDVTETPSWDVGWSVATNGEKIVVGSPGGRVATLFERSADGTWPSKGEYLVPMTRDPYSEFGWRVAIEGERIIVSDPSADNEVDNSGMVYAR